MHFGTTLKKIRIDKGYKQKEICDGIVSLSYYSRIEREVSEPTISIFLKLLKRLSVSFDEFMFLHNNSNESINEQIWVKLTEAYHAGNVEKLEYYKKLLEIDSLKYSSLKEAAELFISRINGEYKNFVDTEPIVKKLMNIDHWTTSEVRIFTTVMDLLPIDTLIFLVNHLLRKRNLYMKSKGYNSPYNKILFNASMICLNLNYLKEAEYYLHEYRKLLETRDLFGHAMHLYLEGLLLYMQGDTTTGLKKVNDFFIICELLQLDEFAKKYRIFFEKLSNKAKK